MSTGLAARELPGAEDWRGAVRLAAEALVRLEVASQDYPAACVRLVEQQGPYIVLTPGLALVHARPADGGLGVGVAVTRLAAPVEFGHPDNDPVDLLLAFCSPDDSAHVTALSTVARALTEGLAARLRAAADENAMTTILKETLADA